jgi:hypothetical protein
MKKLISLLALSIFISYLSAQTGGTLTVTATTSQTSTPTYKPKNIVAMWIEDNSGNFVKTLLALAGERKQYLKSWLFVTSKAKLAYNTVDAKTGATQTSHAARTCTWNGKNHLSVLVADGTYTLKMELTDNDGAKQNLASFTFTKGTSIQTLTPATTSGFSNISIEWIPLNTAIEEVEESSNYIIYPNPAGNFFNVTGDDIKRIEICNLDGKKLYSSNEKKIFLNFLPNGMYMVNIFVRNGIVMRKLIKE